jgi:DNA-binding IclR family transcriptional regulator
MPQPARAIAASPGTQSISRASLLVRLIAMRNRDGMRLVDLVQHARLERPTVRRILKCMIAEGLVMQDADSHRYFLGPLMFELGLAAAPQFDLRDICRPALQRIADRTGDTVFLTVRSGDDSVCLDRAEGSFPIKALTLDVGTRRPLGAGAGGMALLMPLDPAAVDAIVSANAARLRGYNNLTAAALLKMLARARRAGYALNDIHITPGAISVGLPIVNPHGAPFAAVSVGAIAGRMTPERRQEIVGILGVEVERLSVALVDATRPRHRSK